MGGSPKQDDMCVCASMCLYLYSAGGQYLFKIHGRYIYIYIKKKQIDRQIGRWIDRQIDDEIRLDQIRLDWIRLDQIDQIDQIDRLEKLDK